MKCNRCPSQIELMWPENWKKGMKPIVKETGLPHTCIETPKNKAFRKGSCRNCNIEIAYNPKYYNPSGLCEDCKAHHELMDK